MPAVWIRRPCEHFLKENPQGVLKRYVSKSVLAVQVWQPNKRSGPKPCPRISLLPSGGFAGGGECMERQGEVFGFPKIKICGIIRVHGKKDEQDRAGSDYKYPERRTDP